MHPALFKLVRLQLKGWLRRQFTGGSLRRTAFGAVATVLFVFWFIGAAVGASVQTPSAPEQVLAILPLYLTAFALLPMITGNDDRAIAFTPAEIDFLFPGPFGRRDLVVFKLTKLVLSSLAAGVFFTLFLHRYSASLAACVVGAALSLTFINLLATIIALIRQTMEQRAYALARQALTALFLGAAAGVGWYATRSDRPLDSLRALGETPLVHALTAPARVFAHVFASRTLAEFGAWAVACVGMIAGAVALVLALDRGYMEAALAASHRREAKLSGMRRGLLIAPGKPVRAVRVPDLSVFGPGAAIVRRQLVTALRASRGWLVLFVIAAGYGYFVSRYVLRHRDDPARIAPLAPGLMILLTVIPQMLRFDFRGELDCMETLKALPMSARTVARAELAVPTAILTLQAWAVIAVAGALSALGPATLAMAALGAFPAAALVIGLENFVFLIVPTRLLAQGQASAAFSGRRIVMLLARLALILVGGGVVGAVGLAAWAASGSVAATFAACWLAAMLIAGAVVWAVAWAFERFDLSVDLPT
jgi:hypothetical protein